MIGRIASGGITVRTDVVPTRVAAGQLSAWKAACAQRGFELGSPARPGGRLIVRSRTCSLPENSAWIVTSGCEPAWSDFGVTLNAGTSNCACAIAGRSKVNEDRHERGTHHCGAPV